MKSLAKKAAIPLLGMGLLALALAVFLCFQTREDWLLFRASRPYVEFINTRPTRPTGITIGYLYTSAAPLRRVRARFVLLGVVAFYWEEVPAALGESEIDVGISRWLLFVSGAILVIAAAWSWAKRQKVPLWFCPGCSYDLRAHKIGDNCPECGTLIPPPPEPPAKQ